MDLWVAATLTAAQAIACTRWGHADVLARVEQEDISGLYLSIASVVGIVNAFSLAALSFVREGNGPRLGVLRRQAGATIIRSWLFSVVGSLAIAGLLVLLAILAAADMFPVLRWTALAGVYFALLAGGRSLWVFSQVVLVGVEDMTSPVGQDPPAVVRREPRENVG